MTILASSFLRFLCGFSKYRIEIHHGENLDILFFFINFSYKNSAKSKTILAELGESQLLFSYGNLVT